MTGQGIISAARFAAALLKFKAGRGYESRRY
jgi:hypothetical protein